MYVTDKNSFDIKIKQSLDLKDKVLDYISYYYNTPQFTSYAPFDLKPRYYLIYGLKPNEHYATIEKTLQILIDNSLEKFINI